MACSSEYGAAGELVGAGPVGFGVGFGGVALHPVGHFGTVAVMFNLDVAL